MYVSHRSLFFFSPPNGISFYCMYLGLRAYVMYIIILITYVIVLLFCFVLFFLDD